MVDAAAFLGGGAGLNGVLYTAENVFVDERLVTPVDLFTLVAHVAEVVSVAQHQREFVDRDLLGRVSRGRSAAQAPVVEFIRQVGQGVIAGGVQLEGQPDEGSTVGVEGDGADLAAFRAVEDIKVTYAGSGTSPGTGGPFGAVRLRCRDRLRSTDGR